MLEFDQPTPSELRRANALAWLSLGLIALGIISTVYIYQKAPQADTALKEFSIHVGTAWIALATGTAIASWLSPLSKIILFTIIAALILFWGYIAYTNTNHQLDNPPRSNLNLIAT